MIIKKLSGIICPELRQVIIDMGCKSLASLVMGFKAEHHFKVRSEVMSERLDYEVAVELRPLREPRLEHVPVFNGLFTAFGTVMRLADLFAVFAEWHWAKF
jgi:hypothetical protein